MKDTEGTEVVAVPKWLAGVVGAVVGAIIIGGITQGLLLYTQLQVTNERLSAVSVQINKLEAGLNNLRGQTHDRYTQTMHNAYSAHVAGEVRELHRKIQAHAALPWHREAGAEHAETKRRVSKLEETVKELQDELRKK